MSKKTMVLTAMAVDFARLQCHVSPAFPEKYGKDWMNHRDGQDFVKNDSTL